jgi:F-type H+-transporting ATPase subunit a
VAGPLEQFEVNTIVPMQLAGYDISITNSAVYMAITLLTIMFFMIGGMRKTALVPGRWQSSVEMCYEFIVIPFFVNLLIFHICVLLKVLRLLI